MDQVVEHLPSNSEALSLYPNTTKKEKEKNYKNASFMGKEPDS
jgi:hypothetical protein